MLGGAFGAAGEAQDTEPTLPRRYRSLHPVATMASPPTLRASADLIELTALAALGVGIVPLSTRRRIAAPAVLDHAGVAGLLHQRQGRKVGGVTGAAFVVIAGPPHAFEASLRRYGPLPITTTTRSPSAQTRWFRASGLACAQLGGLRVIAGVSGSAALPPSLSTGSGTPLEWVVKPTDAGAAILPMRWREAILKASNGWAAAA